MNEKLNFYSVATLAGLIGCSPRTIQLRLQRGEIESDANLILPDGRHAALFHPITALTLTERQIAAQKPKDVL